jgi:hypothetical protein
MQADVCRAIRGDLAAVALDRADPDDRTRVIAHVDGCPDCRDLLVELRLTVRALPWAAIEHIDADHVPPGDLLDRITAEVRSERSTTRRRRIRRAAASVLAAAAAVAFVFAGFLIARDRGGAPDLQPFAVAPAGADVRFGLQRNDQGTQIVLQQQGLDPNGVYWMWLADQSGQRFTAGTFRGGAKVDKFRMQSALPLDETVRVWCTDAEQDVVLDSWVQR